MTALRKLNRKPWFIGIMVAILLACVIFLLLFVRNSNKIKVVINPNVSGSAASFPLHLYSEGLSIEEQQVQVKHHYWNGLFVEARVPLIPGAKSSESSVDVDPGAQDVANLEIGKSKEYTVNLLSDDIFRWYKSEMGKMGYREEITTSANSTEIRGYRNDKKTLIWVLVTPMSTGQCKLSFNVEYLIPNQYG